MQIKYQTRYFKKQRTAYGKERQVDFMTEELKTIQKHLKKELDKDRYEHTLGVMYTASCLAMRYHADMNQAMTAGLLHDCAKCLSDSKKIQLCEKNNIPIREIELENPFLLHAKVGALLAKKQYNIEDTQILHAIEVHTTGEKEMSLLDKILFVSDYIEPNRNKAPNLTEIRSLAFEDLDSAVLRILYDTLHFLNKKRGAIDKKTQETYEYYASKTKMSFENEGEQQLKGE